MIYVICGLAMAGALIAIVVVLSSTPAGTEYVERMNRVRDLDRRRRDGR